MQARPTNYWRVRRQADADAGCSRPAFAPGRLATKPGERAGAASCSARRGRRLSASSMRAHREIENRCPTTRRSRQHGVVRDDDQRDAAASPGANGTIGTPPSATTASGSSGRSSVRPAARSPWRSADARARPRVGDARFAWCRPARRAACAAATSDHCRRRPTSVGDERRPSSRLAWQGCGPVRRARSGSLVVGDEAARVERACTRGEAIAESVPFMRPVTTFVDDAEHQRAHRQPLDADDPPRAAASLPTGTRSPARLPTSTARNDGAQISPRSSPAARPALRPT